MPIKFLLLGGVLGFLRMGGVEVPILFLWARGFFRIFSTRACPFLKRAFSPI